MNDAQRKKNRRSYFNEFAFHRVVGLVNEQRDARGETLLTTNDARALHDRFLTELAQSGSNMGSVGYARFAQAANRVFGPYYHADVFGDTPTSDGKSTSGRSLYDSFIPAFSALTGYGMNNGNGPAPLRMLPLSPYDKRYAGRDLFLRNGGELLFAPIGERTDSNGVPRSGILDDNGDRTVNREDEIMLYRMDNNGNFFDAGFALTDNDRSGLSQLSMYMTPEEMKDVAEWMAKPGMRDASQFMSQSAIDRSAAVLRLLREDGIAYTIHRDQKEGQIMASLTGTKINVRLSDTRRNEHWVGRVYDNGISFRYTTDKFAKKGEQRQAYVDPSAEDVVRLVKYAMGESVDRQDASKQVGLPNMYKAGYKVKNTSFYTARPKRFSTVMDRLEGDQYARVRLYVENERSESLTKQHSPEMAMDFLRQSVDMARKSYKDAVDVNRLVRLARKHADDETYFPAFHGDDSIAAVQQAYWEVLTGRRTDLLRPGNNAKAFRDVLDEDEQDVADVSVDHMMDELFGDASLSDDAKAFLYEGTPEEKVRQHLADSLDYRFGTADIGRDGKRFDPAVVADFMGGEYGRFRNSDDLAEAIRVADIDPDELKGSDFANALLKDKLIKFDEASAKPMSQSSSPFIRAMGEEIMHTVSQTGCTIKDADILIDDNGLVHYTAQRVKGAEVLKHQQQRETVHGQIGQIFAPDDMGLVETKFAGSPNYLFVPGYEAYVVPQKLGEQKSMEERTRLRGYEQLMRRQIRYQVRSDLLENVPECGRAISLNNVYRRVYDTRYPTTFLQDAHMQGLSDEDIRVRLATDACAVRYGTEYRDGSTINADFQAQRRRMDPTVAVNDNFGDAYSLTGHRNMSVMGEEGDGYFDPIATGTGINQGILRFLTEGAKVNPDGTITPSEDKDDRTPLLKSDVCALMKYTPFDRQQMVFSNLRHSKFVTKNVHMAHMTFGGWTMDDAYVVSKDFAENHQVMDSDGNMRSLRIGDKICDFSGNKGVISLVVDPDMPLEEAEAKGIRQPVEWFKANKGNLDIVGAPFTAPSRFNGGTAREMMQGAKDLVKPDGTVLEGCIGTANMIVTDMLVDEKTHIYGDDDVAAGKGRKYSAQWAWAMASQDATRVMQEAYGSNSKATANLREMLIATGMDISPTGDLYMHYRPHDGEERQVWNIPKLQYRTRTVNGNEVKSLDVRAMKRDFGDLISNRGGFLEIPFPLKYPTGETMMPLTPDKKDVNYKATEWERKSYTMERNGKTIVVPATTVHRHEDASTKRSQQQSYGMPILSAHLRSGQLLQDGSSITHDYTGMYLRIYESALKYKDAQSRGSEEDMAFYQQKAQAEYDRFANELMTRKFTGKYNLFRDDLMANRAAKSSTAVWTPDPRLDVDEIALSSEMAASLEVQDGSDVLVWRDPVLRDAGVRMMRVRVDSELTGAAINPVMDKPFDGDFDGDSVGIAVLQTKSARREAMEKLSVGTNLLEKGAVRDDGSFDLLLNTGLDVCSAAYENDSFAEKMEVIRQQANAIDKEGRKPNKAECDDMVGKLSEAVHEGLDEAYATDVICYKDIESHMRSVEHMVINGAKGSYSKLKDYGVYFGVQFDLKDNPDGSQSIDYDTLRDNGDTLATRSHATAVEYATAVKAFGTGVAGKYSQRGMSTMRNTQAKAVLELTYPVTQAILQAKHDPVAARHKYEMLMGPARSLWRGQKIERSVDKDGNTAWRTVREDGKLVRMTAEEWEKTFVEFYHSKDGLNVDINPAYVKDVASALTDENGMIINMEEDRSRASVMDAMAYDGDWNDLKAYAEQSGNIFDGAYNQHFAPRTIRDNITAVEYGESVKAIVKSDTKSERKIRKSEEAVSVDRKRKTTSDGKPTGRRDIDAPTDTTGHGDGDSPNF